MNPTPSNRCPLNRHKGRPCAIESAYESAYGALKNEYDSNMNQQTNPDSATTGSITRGGLTLALTLKGEARLAAHLEIHRLMRASQWDRKQISAPYDARLAEIFALDPSLLIETIPKTSPLELLGGHWPVPVGPWETDSSNQSEPTDVEWGFVSRSYGCWLVRLSDFNLNFKDCIEVGLKAGASPLDLELFNGRRPLFETSGWSQTPEKLAIGLRYLANFPEDADIKAYKSSMLRAALSRAVQMIEVQMVGDKKKLANETLVSAFECIPLLVEHGTTYALDAIEKKGGMPSGFSRLCASSVDSYDKGVQAAYQASMVTLVRAGASINEETGPWWRSPLIHAVNGDSGVGISTLIGLGCDYSRLQINKGKFITDIVEHSRESNQPSITATLVESIMARRIKEKLATPDEEVQAPQSSKVRRRLSV